MRPLGRTCSKAHFWPNLQLPWRNVSHNFSKKPTQRAHGFLDGQTFEKYLHGVSNFDVSSECEKGHALPAWHCPCLKNLQGT